MRQIADRIAQNLVDKSKLYCSVTLNLHFVVRVRGVTTFDELRRETIVCSMLSLVKSRILDVRIRKIAKSIHIFTYTLKSIYDKHLLRESFSSEKFIAATSLFLKFYLIKILVNNYFP